MAGEPSGGIEVAVVPSLPSAEATKLTAAAADDEKAAVPTAAATATAADAPLVVPYAMLSMAALQITCTAGVVYGWPGLLAALIRDRQYADLCAVRPPRRARSCQLLTLLETELTSGPLLVSSGR
jgi:hypothetical protein